MSVSQNTLNNKVLSCILWSTVALCLSFAPLLVNFVWGNHDWMPLLTDSSLSSGLIEGRFSQYILLNIILGGKILPILNLLLGFAFYSTALVLLWNNFFKFSLTKTPATLFIITATTLPYINELLYFQFIVFSQLTWPVIIVLSLLAAQKASEKNYISNTFISACLLFLAVGGYPASAGLYATAACLWALNLTQSHTSAKQFTVKLFPFAISLLFALITVNFVYIFLQKNGLMIPLYNNKPATPIEILSRIPTVILVTIQSLIQPQPFFSILFKITTTLIITLFIYKRLSTNKSIIQFILNLLLIIILLLSAKLPALISQNNSDNYFAQYDPVGFMVRTDFYTIPCLILYCLFYLWQNSKQYLRNTIYTLSMLLIIINTNANLTFCKTYILGFNAENILLQRITSRIQNKPQYTPKHLYTIVQVGEQSLRAKYYIPQNFEKYGYYTLQTPFTRYWIPNEYYNFSSPTVFIKKGNSLNPQTLSTQAVAFLTKQITPWPSVNALYLENDYIILALTPQGKDTLVQQFNSIKR